MQKILNTFERERERNRLIRKRINMITNATMLVVDNIIISTPSRYMRYILH